MDIPKNDSARCARVTVNGVTIQVRQALLPVVTIYPPSLRIVIGAKGTTGPQEVQLRVSGPGAVTWRLASAGANLRLDHTIGSAPDRLLVSYTTSSGLPPAQTLVSLQVDLAGADQASMVRFLGSVAVTVEPWTTSGSQGGVWRDPVGPARGGNGRVYIGDAVCAGCPSDESSSAAAPGSRGWGYLMLTTGLPAVTAEGQRCLRTLRTGYRPRGTKSGSVEIRLP